ncbi:MAG: diguanylate cyclase [Leptolyngbyaceae cyanobacterium T60_A2020_046]|nr:diguanylate cyclase [Leptolyngbyaceae cyanobacterium T60_A2020_046]
MATALGPFVDWAQLAATFDFAKIAGADSPLQDQPAAMPRSFAELLAPLNRDATQRVIHQVDLQLQIVSRTLVMLEGQAFEQVLQDMLQACALKLGELLGADRTTVFLADAGRKELWSILAEAGHAPGIEIRLSWDQGIAGAVARTKQAINVPFDFYDDPRSQQAQFLDRQHDYRTYTLLALPILDQQNTLLAVVQLLNKCQPDSDPKTPLADRIDREGFTETDIQTFGEFATIIRRILESSRAFYLAARRQRAASVLVKATQALNHSGLDLSDTLRRVMEEAKTLMQADRSTLWVLDRDRKDLWANLPMPDGTVQTVRVPVGEGYVGTVAETAKILNIPYDLYDDPASHTARDTDRRSGYRTYSLLCMPVFDTEGTLIGVTQLVNKYRTGVLSACRVVQNSDQFPDCFRASFTDEDEFFMLAFNIHAGVALERALLFSKMEQKVAARTRELQAKNEQLQHEIREREKAEQALSEANRRLSALALVDALTGVANRRQFDERLIQEWRRMRREQSPLSLILCDIDSFKRYNDRYGHVAGDNCLRRVAAAMTELVRRPGDLLARYGGEEFAVILPRTDSQGAQHIAEALRQRVIDLAIPHEDSEVCDRVTLSLGVATDIPTDHLDVQRLLMAADMALYSAKQRGRDRVMVADIS